jgi:hypothetical protein
MSDTKEKLLPQSIGGREFSMWAFDNSLRIEQIIPLSCAADADEASDVLESLIDDTEDERLSKLFGFDVAKALKQWGHDDEEMEESERRSAILEMLMNRGMFGFLVKAETPVKRYMKEIASYSWGYCTYEWLYADALDGAFVAKLSLWLDKCRKRDKKESKATNPEGKVTPCQP